MAKTSDSTEQITEVVDEQSVAPLSEAVVEASQPPSPSVVDEFHGHGGTYLLDPETGIRTRISA
jgi:hypothetical protein